RGERSTRTRGRPARRGDIRDARRSGRRREAHRGRLSGGGVPARHVRPPAMAELRHVWSVSLHHFRGADDEPVLGLELCVESDPELEGRGGVGGEGPGARGAPAVASAEGARRRPRSEWIPEDPVIPTPPKVSSHYP